jgi:hypothetical protein
MAFLMLLRRMVRDDLTAHGFRSTFRDWAAERTNYPNEVAEMALAHHVDNKVEAAYLRSAGRTQGDRCLSVMDAPDLARVLTERELGPEPEVKDFNETMPQRNSACYAAGRDWEHKRNEYEEVLEKGGRGFKTKANPDATPPFAGLLNVELDPRTQKRTKVTLFCIQKDHLPAPADDPRTAPAEYSTQH